MLRQREVDQGAEVSRADHGFGTVLRKFRAYQTITIVDARLVTIGLMSKDTPG